MGLEDIVIIKEDGWYVVYGLDPNNPPRVFDFVTDDGLRIYWRPEWGFYYYYTDEHGLRHRKSYEGAKVGFDYHVVPKFEYIAPELVDGAPTYMWPRFSSNPIALSAHVDTMRWVRATAFIDKVAGFVEIPLLDSDGVPFLDPSIPPAMMMRRHDSVTDRVGAPGASGVRWSDVHMYQRQNSGAVTAVDWSIECGVFPKLDPVPHWVLRIASFYNQTSANECSVIVDMFGNQYAKHSSTSVEVGSSGVAGHYLVELMWSNPGFQEASDRVGLDARQFFRGAIHVQDGATGTFYLTTGASAGTSSGTEAHGTGSDDLPAVLVLGNKTLATDITAAATTTWEPETWGLGLSGVPNAATGREKMYNSEVYRDGTANRWAVDITNEFYTPGGPRDATKDRSFIVFVFGRK